MRPFEQHYQSAISFLKSHSAGTIAHVDGPLLSHLEGTCDLLWAWGNPSELCLAGLCHTVYGTQGFHTSLLDISQRVELRELIGEQAEALVYLFAACDRLHLYRQIGLAWPLEFRDRIKGSTTTLADSLSKSFLELTFANELDGARSNPRFAELTRGVIEPLFRRCEGIVSNAAFAHFLRIYSDAD